MLWLYLIFSTIVISLGASWYVKKTFAKWDKVDARVGLGAFDFARQLLNRRGLTGVQLESTEGELSDHYDPRGSILRISTTVSSQQSVSVAALAVIAHEVGHAEQHKEGQVLWRVRQALVPAAQFGSNLGPILVFIGLLLNISNLTWAGIVFFSVAVLFTAAMLPVEIGASKKALAYLSNWGLSSELQPAAKKVLTAAALTYVAALAVSLLTLLYYIAISRR